MTDAASVAMPAPRKRTSVHQPDRFSPGAGPRASRHRRKTQLVSKPKHLTPTVVGGLAWAGALAAAAAVGPVLEAVVVIPVGLVAAISTVRAVGRHPRTHRPSALAIATSASLAVALPLAALGGFAAAAATAAAGLVAATAVSFLMLQTARPEASVFAMVGPAVAAGSVVLAAHQGRNLALALIAAVCAYDLGCWVYGSSRGVGGEAGVAAGVVTVAAVALFVAAVFVPPFSGFRPWVMFGVIAVLCPGGVMIAERLTPAGAPPALRRIDSLVLAGPFWVAAASLMLHR